MAHTDPHAAGHATAGHETRDVSLGGAPRFIIVMTVFLAVCFAFIAWLFTYWRGTAAANDVPAPPVAQRDGDRLPPLPRLQTTPAVDLRTLHESETQVLESYAWVDKEQGVVRLPIARAIELVAERGLPAPPAATPAAPGAAPAATPAGTPAPPPGQ